MKKLLFLLERAKHSSVHRTLLNFVLARAIPFNAPHGFRVQDVFDDGIKIKLPYKRKNLNHLNGIHACALATLSEYTAGITLSIACGTDSFRLIMKELSMIYHYQAKQDVFAELRYPALEFQRTIFLPLQTQDAVFVEM
ncbi:MAG TPA: DUF4442 domain-containing protein, partial [Bacteroidia bacterium]|nr:DUF4442 domain-containing protein [Bacteroidia bacterium]